MLDCRFSLKMIALFLAVCAFLSACKTGGSSQVKIIGGQAVTNISEFPATVYMAAQVCSGVIISPQHILTAGHCLMLEAGRFSPINNNDHRLAQITSSEREIVRTKVESLDVHPTWEQALRRLRDPDRAADDPTTIDLGIITLREPVSIVPASLLNSPISRHRHQLVLTGGGCTERFGHPNAALKHATVKISNVLTNKIEVGTRGLSGSGEAGACRGDSGGPAYLADETGGLILDGEGQQIIAGINSVLLPLSDQDDPEDALPASLARVDSSSARQWIASVIGDTGGGDSDHGNDEFWHQIGLVQEQSAELRRIRLSRLRPSAKRTRYMVVLSDSTILSATQQSQLAEQLLDETRSIEHTVRQFASAIGIGVTGAVWEQIGLSERQFARLQSVRAMRLAISAKRTRYLIVLRDSTILSATQQSQLAEQLLDETRSIEQTVRQFAN